MGESPRIEPRLACPVCLGVTMDKTEVGARRPALCLDHCSRCGGIWFDAGEVQQLRRLAAAEFWSTVARRTRAHRAQCHSCHAFMDRAAAVCSSCGQQVLLDCPQCGEAMQTATFDDVTLDVCRRCRGIWFDHEELAAIWRLELNRALQQRGRQSSRDGVIVLADALAYDPFLAFYGIHAAAHGAAAAGDLLTSAPAALGGAAEAVGEAATGVFETLLDIIGGIFS